MTKTLAELRIQIDALDQSLLQLLNERAALAHEVGGNTVIDFGGGDQVTLVGVKAVDVQANPSAFFVIS